MGATHDAAVACQTLDQVQTPDSGLSLEELRSRDHLSSQQALEGWSAPREWVTKLLHESQLYACCSNPLWSSL